MPKWQDNRANLLRRRNPDMSKQLSYAIAGKQMYDQEHMTHGPDEKTAALVDEIQEALGSRNGFEKTLSREAQAMADNPTPARYLKQKAVAALPASLAEPISKIGTLEFNALVDELTKNAAIVSRLAGALKNPEIRDHAAELTGLGVLAAPGLDTLQSRARARMAGDTTHEGTEKRRLLGETGHAATDVAGLGILTAPSLAHLMKRGADAKSDAELREVGRQRGVTNLAAEAHREKGRHGERFGEAFGRIAGGIGGAAAGRKHIGGRSGAIAGLAGGLMAGGRVGKELGTERDIHKNAFAQGFSNSQYAGNVAQNGPGMRSHSPLAPYREPPLAVKAAGVGVGSGMSTSQYSGPLSYGPFKMTSGIPAFKSPGMTRDDGSDQTAGWMVGADKRASLEEKLAAGMAALNASTTPAGRLAAGQRVGAPRVTAPAGPSIAELSKPKGFGKPLAGALKAV